MDTGNVNVPKGFDSFGPWFSEAFELFKAQWQGWVVLFLVYMLIVGVISFVLNMIFPLLGILVAIPAALMMPGMVKAGLNQIRGGKVELSDLFSGTDMFVGALVVAIVMSAGVIACGIGVYVTSTLFFLSLPLLVDRKLSIGDALTQSMNVTKQNFFFFLVYMLVMGIVSGIGSIACGVGVLATAPIAFLGMLVAYERTFNAASAAAPAPQDPPAPPAPAAPEAPAQPETPEAPPEQ